jgi:nitroreductase
MTQQPVYDLAITDALLSTTRAVRKRLDLDRPVPRQVLRECLQLSLQAPTGGNRQGWSWVVVEDATKRQALGELFRKGAGNYLDTAGAAAEAAGDAQTLRVLSSARYLYDRVQDVPVHVIPCIDVSQVPDNPPRRVWPSLMGSIFPAVWSFQLALRARGLGSTLTTFHLGCEAEAAALLGIPNTVMQVGLLPVAYTKGTDFKPARRDNLDQVTHWDQW